jgi:hypothetical protein
VPPGQYEGRFRVQVLPGFRADLLTITVATQGGQPLTRTITREELVRIAGAGWVEFSVGPVVVVQQGAVEIRVYGPGAEGILIDERINLVITGEW